jgi:hypothetical protein
MAAGRDRKGRIKRGYKLTPGGRVVKASKGKAKRKATRRRRR